jgi:hypothetical protein
LTVFVFSVSRFVQTDIEFLYAQTFTSDRFQEKRTDKECRSRVPWPAGWTEGREGAGAKAFRVGTETDCGARSSSSLVTQTKLEKGLVNA